MGGIKEVVITKYYCVRSCAYALVCGPYKRWWCDEDPEMSTILVLWLRGNLVLVTEWKF